jgi:hypothetical protein
VSPYDFLIFVKNFCKNINFFTKFNYFLTFLDTAAGGAQRGLKPQTASDFG